MIRGKTVLLLNKLLGDRTKNILILSILFYINSFSQISLTGGPYSQDFNSYIGSESTLPLGWTVSFENAGTYYRGIGTGTSLTGGAWAYGITGIPGDYSLGALRSGTPGNLTFDVSFTNNTGQPITDMVIEWNYEQWRFVNSSGFDVSGTGELSSNIDLNSSDFTGNSLGTHGTVETTHISITLNSINILDGQTFGLEWITTDDAGSDNGVSIDDFQITGPPPLPVELTSFTASVKDNGIKLDWRTEAEVNNYGFEIERQVGSKQTSTGNWNKIGFVEGHGNSNSTKEYSFIDKKISSGRYLYRLKQIDNDGTFTYSNVVNVDANALSYYELDQNYPNPFNPTTKIKFTLPEAANVTVKVFNVLGQYVVVLVNKQMESGTHEVNFDATGLNSGIYFYRIESGNFVSVKKMTLLR